jgi:hypothetical protein
VVPRLDDFFGDLFSSAAFCMATRAASAARSPPKLPPMPSMAAFRIFPLGWWTRTYRSSLGPVFAGPPLWVAAAMPPTVCVASFQSL